MENQYIVSARKYRPSTFESVVGQQHITQTLENAIEHDQLAQALLFCGPRGIGKTSCARILAKRINEHYGQPGEDYSLNIFELDAASNNSVDDIRSLTDQVRFAPQVGRFKVYIIDEVHMLSQAAFNAFLKTLEEPPKHAIFILATTEKHKIIPTILSRCQIFDFKRITVDDIARHLAWVAEQEGIKADPEALYLIAQKSDGAMRDSLSIFDRIASFTSQNITYEAVLENLNILDYDYYFRACDSILAGDVQQLLLLFREILDKGFDPHMFITGLSGHFRDLLVSKDPATLELLEVGESTRTRYLEQSKQCSMGFLVEALKLTTDCDQKYKQSHNQRLHVEVCLLQLAEASAIRGRDEKKKPTTQRSEPVDPKRVVETEEPSVERAPEKNSSGSSPAPATAANPVDPQEADQAPEPEPVPVSEEQVSQAGPDPKPESATTSGEGQNKTRRHGPRLGGFSVQEAVSDTPIVQEGDPSAEGRTNEPREGLPQEVFTERDLKRVWKEYLSRVEHRKSIYNTLSRHEPHLTNGTTIELTLDNKTQEGYLDNERGDMMAFLRRELRNYKVDLEVRIAEGEEVKTLYTPEEKYKHMVERNPLLAEFRKTLNLDLE